ncbi:MAG: hypothetical protein ACRENN_09200 [Candidatus Eiseniibacteriota bacterium]
MTRHAPSTIRPRVLSQTLIAVVLLCPALAVPAVAGFNPMKKAKDAVTKPAEKKVTQPPKGSDEPPVFDEYTLELTEARVEGLIAACKKAAQAAGARQVIADKLSKVQDDRYKLDQKEGEKVRDLQRKRGDIEVCYHDAYQGCIEKRRAELTSKAMSDPSSMQEFTKLAQEQAMAQGKGDTVALQKATAAMMKWGAPTRDDTLAVKKKCGPIPPHSAAEDQLAAYDKQIEGINKELRDADEKAAKEQAKASTMTQEQWATARERMLGFLGAYKPGGSEPGGFSDAEVAAMKKNLDQLHDAQKNGCL